MIVEIHRTQRLREIIRKLAIDIGERNLYQYHNLKIAASFIENSFQTHGYVVSRQIYEVKNKEFSNLETQIVDTDRPHEIIILGAHYDTHRRSPGANDNGSAIAAMLELARVYRGKTFSRTLRFVAFTNEESLFTRKSDMGSRVYARRCREHIA
jgi:Zn-dependent M28 family amino/carboxypeptidase